MKIAKIVTYSLTNKIFHDHICYSVSCKSTNNSDHIGCYMTSSKYIWGYGKKREWIIPAFFVASWVKYRNFLAFYPPIINLPLKDSHSHDHTRQLSKNSGMVQGRGSSKMGSNQFRKLWALPICHLTEWRVTDLRLTVCLQINLKAYFS